MDAYRVHPSWGIPVRLALHPGIVFHLHYLAIPLILSCAGFLHAQNALSNNGQVAPENGGTDSPQGTALSAPDAEFHPSLAGFGQGRGPAKDLPSSASRWNLVLQDLIRDAYQLGTRSGNHSQGAGSSASFNGGGAGYGIGGAAPSGGGAGPAGAASPINPDSLFSMASGLSRDLGTGRSGGLGAALGVLPTLNQISRGGLSLPLDTSLGSFKLVSPNLFGDAMGGRMGAGFPSASFTSTHSFASTHSGSGKVNFSAAAAVSGGGLGGNSGMSAGLSSFGSQNGGGSPFSMQLGGGTGSAAGGGSMGGQRGGPGAGSGGPGRPGNGGGKAPAVNLSFHLNF